MLKTDVSSFSTIQKTINNIKKEVGTVDILVNNGAFSNDGNLDLKREKAWKSKILHYFLQELQFFF